MTTNKATNGLSLNDIADLFDLSLKSKRYFYVSQNTMDRFKLNETGVKISVNPFMPDNVIVAVNGLGDIVKIFHVVCKEESKSNDTREHAQVLS